MNGYAAICKCECDAASVPVVSSRGTRERRCFFGFWSGATALDVAHCEAAEPLEARAALAWLAAQGYRREVDDAD